MAFGIHIRGQWQRSDGTVGGLAGLDDGERRYADDVDEPNHALGKGVAELVDGPAGIAAGLPPSRRGGWVDNGTGAGGARLAVMANQEMLQDLL